MHRDEGSMIGRLRFSLLGVLIVTVLSSCAAGIDIVRYSSETYPPKGSMHDVQILDERPEAAHIRLAQLVIVDSKDCLRLLQNRILIEAAAMGADAVVFMDPEVDFRTTVQYAPVYRSWGYYSSGYGWYGGGYGAVPTTYKTRRNTLAGIAIRYTGGTS